MHVRKAIRDAVVAALNASSAVAALASPSPAIESGRIVPIDPAAMPRVLVYLRGEKAEGLLTISPRSYELTGELIVAYVERVKIGSTIPEDRLDTAAEALESVLDTLEASRFGGLTLGADYQATDVSVELDAEQIVATVSIRYALSYERTTFASIADDFETNVVTYDVGDAPADQPGDEITLPIV